MLGWKPARSEKQPAGLSFWPDIQQEEHLSTTNQNSPQISKYFPTPSCVSLSSQVLQILYG